MKLDNVDLSIIKELQRDSRLSMRELGRKSNCQLRPSQSVSDSLNPSASLSAIHWTLIKKRSGFLFPALSKRQ